MTDVERQCIHNDYIPASQCTTCKTAARRLVLVYGGSALARFPGACRLCDDPVQPGDLIVGWTEAYADDPTDITAQGWAHQDCVP